MIVPFSQPSHCKNEIEALQHVLVSGRLEGGGSRTKSCHKWLETHIGCHKALLTTSGTAALEMACLLLDLNVGDEVILPSFTFSSCANAIALRGGVPVFVDIHPDTLNIDENLIENAITPHTRAIMPVHYAGVGSNMCEILKIAQNYNLTVIEDAAQAIGASYQKQPLGSFGQLSALSFHATKNVSCGEGGALLINEPSFMERAEILWEKGTNRAQFIRGDIKKYTWCDLGSSFLPSEMTASLLESQLLRSEQITKDRQLLWNRYHEALLELEAEGFLRRPTLLPDCDHNAHIYYVLLSPAIERNKLIARLHAFGVDARFHYVPLHSAPAGQRYGRVSGSMKIVDDISARLLRLPLFSGLDLDKQDSVIKNFIELVRSSL